MRTFYKYLDNKFSNALFYKQSNEKFQIQVEFLNALENDASIDQSNSSVIAYSSSGEDVSSAVLDGTLEVSGTKIIIAVKNGTDQEKYKITFKAVTETDGYIYEMDVYMHINNL